MEYDLESPDLHSNLQYLLNPEFAENRLWMGHKHTTKALSTSAHRLPISDRKSRQYNVAGGQVCLEKLRIKGGEEEKE